MVPQLWVAADQVRLMAAVAAYFEFGHQRAPLYLSKMGAADPVAAKVAGYSQAHLAVPTSVAP